nr:PAS domain S-box protein [Pseudopedobacter sp.]
MMKKKMNESHVAFQKLIEHSIWGITLLDEKFNATYSSPSAERINGWDKNVRLEDPNAIIIHPDDLEAVNALMNRVAHIPGLTETCTFRSKHFNGNYIWLQCSFTNMLEELNIKSIVCNFIDVSEQKSSDFKLTLQTEQITELLETMTDGFISLDENLCYTYANEKALKMANKTREDLIGRYIWDVVPDAIGSATYQAIQTAFIEKKYVCNEDFYAPLQLWQENRVYPSGGGVSLFMRDITKQKKEEHHLKLLESVITNTTDAVMITEAEPFDLPGPQILYVNEAFTKMTGYTSEEVIGKTPRILQGPKTNKEELKRLDKCLRSWSLCEATLINYKKNGEQFWNNFSLNPVTDEKGSYTHWIAIEREVTQHKNEEREKVLLAETSKIFNEPIKLSVILKKVLEKIIVYDHFGIAEIWLTGADTSKISLVAKTSRNEKKAAFYKETSQFQSFVKGESLPGAVWKSGKILTWNHLDERPDFLRHKAAQNTGIKVAYGIPLISEKVTIGVMVIGLAEESPEESRIMMPLFEKLSAHFGVEIKRKQLEEELYQIFSFAPDIICTLGTDGYFKKINPAMSNLLGYSETELLTHPLKVFLHPEDFSSSQVRMEKFNAGEKTLSFENRFLTKAGEVLWLSWTTHLNDREGLLFCVAKDITAKKQAEQMLYTSESNLTAVIENTDACIYSLDMDLKYVTYNKKLSNLMQELYQVRITPGYPIFDFIKAHQPEEVKEWRQIYLKALAGEVVKFEKESSVGDLHNYNNFSIHPIWQNKKVTGLSCFVNDITARKLSESLLIASEKRYSELFQFSPLPKVVFDLETLKFLDVNKAAVSLYGYTKKEFLQMTLAQIRSPENNSISKEILNELKQAKGTTVHHAILHQKKDGKKISVDIQSNPVLFDEKNARIAAINDVTESLHYIQAIEAQNERFKEISWMQSHIIRAPLARIMGLIPLINDTDGSPNERREMMDYLLKSAHELDKVIKEISLKTEITD